MKQLSKTDRKLVAAARRDLRKGTVLLGSGRRDDLRSQPFMAKFDGRCPRCGKRIAYGSDVRFHQDFDGPVHVGCREPGVTRSAPRRRKPEPATPCPDCHIVHAGDCL